MKDTSFQENARYVEINMYYIYTHIAITITSHKYYINTNMYIY